MNECADLLMINEFSAFGGRQASLDLGQKPFVIVHKTLDGLADQGLSVPALLGSKSGEFGLQVGSKFNFHGVQGMTH